jgi:hypothetical protein
MKEKEQRKSTAVGVLEGQPPNGSNLSGSTGPIRLDWPNATRALILGQKVTRLAWDDDKTYLVIAEKFLRIHQHGQLAQLLVSDEDMFADDWVVLDVDA